MKEFFRSFFASLLAIIVSGIFLIVLFVFGIAVLVRSVSDADNKKFYGNMLVIDVTKRIHEQGQTNMFAALSDKSGYEPGLYDIEKALDNAKEDRDIYGVLLKLGPSPNGWATLQQLQKALKDFRSSGKFVYAYGEQIPQSAYFAATAADSIYLNPAGSIDLKGFATVLTFFKGTLDKLEIQPEIFYCGKFKSATEPFRADKMSEPNKQQVAGFQAGMWNEFLGAAAGYIHTGKDTIHQWAVSGAIQFPTDAAKYKMVAGLLYWDEVEQRILRKTGMKERGDIKYVSVNDYSWSNKTANAAGEQRIAVIFAEGEISDGEQNNDVEIASQTLCETIRKVAKNDRVKAVVLRVNSPGGSALASDVILRELELLKQKKHLVVSMGDYAASGGYYISSKADSIFAMPNTITGSIGVFGMMFSIDKLMKDKLGVTFDGVKNAPYADVPTATRPMTAEEARRMQSSVDTIYAHFKGHVAMGRKLSVEYVDSIAQGRVWTGTDALKNGLVDGLGGLDRAIASAASLAKVSQYKVVTYPEPTSKFSKLFNKLSNNAESGAAIKAGMKQELGDGYELYEKIQGLRKMSGKAMMAMPFIMKTE